MKITKFDKATIRASGIPDAAVAAMAEVAKRHGLTVSYAGGSFDELSFTIKLRLAVDDPGKTQDAKRRRFDTCCGYLGMKPEHFGATFTMRGQDYRVTGIDLGRPRFPILGERCGDGRSFKFGTEVVPLLKTVAAA